jgi:hypothetical protein
MRVALCGDPRLVEQITREVVGRFGLREVTAADLPWPERFPLRERPITSRHPAAQRLGARLTLAAARTGYVLVGLPTEPTSVEAVLDRAGRLDVVPRIAIAVGRTPPAFGLVELAAHDVLRVRRADTAVPVVLSYLSTFAEEVAPARVITLPDAQDVKQAAHSVR